jgi:hypothetical protein
MNYTTPLAVPGTKHAWRRVTLRHIRYFVAMELSIQRKHTPLCERGPLSRFAAFRDGLSAMAHLMQGYHGNDEGGQS